MIRLTVVAGPDAGSTFAPPEDTVDLGRSHRCGVVLRDETVSKRHCTIERRGDRFVIIDLHSANGTFLNTLQDRVDDRELKNGDEIILGKSRLRVELAMEGGSGATRPGSPPSDGAQAEGAKETAAASRPETAAGKGLDAVRQPDVPIVL